MSYAFVEGTPNLQLYAADNLLDGAAPMVSSSVSASGMDLIEGTPSLLAEHLAAADVEGDRCSRRRPCARPERRWRGGVRLVTSLSALLVARVREQSGDLIRSEADLAAAGIGADGYGAFCPSCAAPSSSIRSATAGAERVEARKRPGFPRRRGHQQLRWRRRQLRQPGTRPGRSSYQRRRRAAERRRNRERCAARPSAFSALIMACRIAPPRKKALLGRDPADRVCAGFGRTWPQILGVKVTVCDFLGLPGALASVHKTSFYLVPRSHQLGRRVGRVRRRNIGWKRGACL